MPPHFRIQAGAARVPLAVAMAIRATTVQITMPAMGESVTEGTVLEWLKQVGDRVEADEPLVEVSTDKVDAEVPAPASGTLTKILVEADSAVNVGEVLGEIEAGEDDSAAATAAGGAGAGAAPAAAEAPLVDAGAPAAGGDGAGAAPADEEAQLVDVAFPQMGDSVSEGTVLEWLKQTGDPVAAEEGLVEISTDKVDAEVPAPAAGTVAEILVDADETVAVGTLL